MPKRRVTPATWIVLAAALFAFNIFAFQVALVPQTRDYRPDWHGAQWITPLSSGTVAYYRKTVTLAEHARSAFITVQGWQAFTLSVNGNAVAATKNDFTNGATNLAYSYDITPFLRIGGNTFAIRAVNYDQGSPAMRAVAGVAFGRQAQLFPSDASWLATSDAQLAHPLHVPNNAGWTTPDFDDGAWRGASVARAPASDGVLHVPPAVFEQPLPESGVTSSADDGFFTRNVMLPAGGPLPARGTIWLRVATTGDAEIYLDGYLIATQMALDVPAPSQGRLPRAASLTADVYDVTTYVHGGVNTIAVHVTGSAIRLPNGSMRRPPAALALDLIAVNGNGTAQTIAANPDWRAATRALASWEQGGGTGWQSATAFDLTSYSITPPYRVIATDHEQQDFGRIALVIAVTTLLFVLGCGLANEIARVLARRNLSPSSLNRLAIAFIPALALFGLLWMLTYEPLMPHPFPFTWFWLATLIAVTATTAALIRYGERLRTIWRWGQAVEFACQVRAIKIAPEGPAATRPASAGLHLPHHLCVWEATGSPRSRMPDGPVPVRCQRTSWPQGPGRQPLPSGAVLTAGWRAALITRFSRRISPTTIAVVVLALVGLYMATYQLNYEVFWQDEATSVYAAQQVLHTGIPRLLSGFIYTKSELYSYMLAVIELFVGTDPVALRLLSVAEYVASLVLTFHVGRRFFDKRVGLLAMALLVFSPLALRWGREARMYQQAELCLLIVIYLFYQVLQDDARARTIYLNMAVVVVMYLSHEETFIVLPALLLCFLAAQRLRWMRDPHWWIAGMSAMAIILLQLLLAQTTHPPILGTDRSQIPMIAFAPQNFDFYMRLLFASRAMGHGTYPALGVISTLAVVAAVVALFVPHRPLRYLCAVFFVSLGCLIFTFTLTADRYIYPLLPVMVLLAAAMVVWGCDRLARWLHQQLDPVAARIIMAMLTLLFVGMVLVAQTPDITNFGLAISRTLGLPYHHLYPDYQAAGQYIQAHWQQGDILITIAPAIDGAFYAHRPSYLIYQNKALYLIAQNGHIVDTPTGSTVLLNEQDLDAVLATHHRVWVLAADGYNCCEDRGEAPIGQHFALVFEGQTTYVYLRSG